MARPLLSIVLALVAVGLGAAALGMYTGWFDIGAILSDAVVQTLGGLLDAVVSTVEGAVQWFIDELANALNPV
ncbi:hypothetical protein GCM10009037_06750 [Halarchaeum grantii]|uniref:Uncharacterized protein n=1 Tax=Halarchaeum grantii TaxID=1193105 RepID=A0A830ESH4_9EURY|nr:hypothetical protein [Halarchaeum grantii]GGL25793.1 hypothetical protein GCM10009037_06750 [Halarchaeum grantii]